MWLPTLQYLTHDLVVESSLLGSKGSTTGCAPAAASPFETTGVSALVAGVTSSVASVVPDVEFDVAVEPASGAEVDEEPLPDVAFEDEGGSTIGASGIAQTGPTTGRFAAHWEMIACTFGSLDGSP